MNYFNTYIITYISAQPENSVLISSSVVITSVNTDHMSNWFVIYTVKVHPIN